MKSEHTNLLRRWMKKRPNVEYECNALIQRLDDHYRDIASVLYTVGTIPNVTQYQGMALGADVVWIFILTPLNCFFSSAMPYFYDFYTGSENSSWRQNLPMRRPTGLLTL